MKPQTVIKRKDLFMFSAIKKFFRFIFNDKTQSIPKKLLLASLVNFAFIFSVLVFIPYETFFGNIAEFTFTFSDEPLFAGLNNK